MRDLSNLYPIQIVDIYSDNRWNADEEKAKGTRGVIFKAGQGGWPSIPRQYIADAKRVGLLWGVYWIIDSRYDSGYHMRAIKATFPTQDFGPLGLYWDCEKPRVTMNDKDYWKTPYSGNGLFQAVIEKFIGWAGKSGRIYTASGFSSLLGWGGSVFKIKPLYKILKNMDLWAAQYNDFITEPTPFGVWERGNWLFWQYRENPDYNYFHGDANKWEELFGEASQTIPETTPDSTTPPVIIIPGPEMKTYTGTVIWSNGATARTAPNTYAPSVHVFPKNSIVHGIGIVPDSLDPGNPNKKWMRLTDAYIAVDYPSGTKPTSRIDYHEDVPVTPTTAKLARVKTCYQMTGYSKVTLKEKREGNHQKAGQKSGFPDTVQYEGLTNDQNKSVVLTEAIQWAWYNACVKRASGTKKWQDDQFNSLTRGDAWVTNNAGSKDHQVYPTGANPDKEPMKYETVLTSGAILEIVNDNSRPGFTAFRCINASLPMDDFTPEKAPFCWYTPMNSIRIPLQEWNNNHTGKKFMGHYDESQTEPFGQFNNKAFAPILMPNTSVAWIRTELLEFL